MNNSGDFHVGDVIRFNEAPIFVSKEVWQISDRFVIVDEKAETGELMVKDEKKNNENYWLDRRYLLNCKLLYNNGINVLIDMVKEYALKGDIREVNRLLDLIPEYVYLYERQIF